MPAGHLGTIWASVGLDVAPLGAGAARARRMMYALDATMSKSTAAMSSTVTRATESAMGGFYALSKGATMAGAIVGGISIKMANDFDSAMHKVWSLTKGGREQIEQWSSKVLEMTKDLPVLAKDAAQALYWIKSAMPDASDTEMFSTLEWAIKGAVGGVAELSDAASALTGAMMAYQDIRPEHYIDVMAKTVERGKLTMQDMASNLGKVVGMASQAKIPFEELGAAIAVLTRYGVPADTAFMALNQLLMKIVKPTKESQEVMERYGIDLSIAALKAKGLGGVLAEVTEKVKDNDEALINLFPNIRAIKAALPLAGKGAREFADELKIMGSASGTVSRMFEKNMGSMENKIKVLIQRVRNELIKLGIAIFPLFEELAGKATWLARVLVKAYPAVILFASSFLSFKVLSGVSNLLYAVGNAASGLSGAFGTAGTAVGLFALRLSSIAPIIGAAIGAAMMGGWALAQYFRKQSEAMDEAWRLTRENDKAMSQLGRSLEPLIDRYIELHNRTSLTNDEQAEMVSLQNQIADKAPNLAAGIDAQGNSYLKADEYLRQYLKDLKALSDTPAGEPAMKGTMGDYQAQVKSIEDLQKAYDQMGFYIDRMTTSMKLLNMEERDIASIQTQLALDTNKGRDAFEAWLKLYGTGLDMTRGFGKVLTYLNGKWTEADDAISLIREDFKLLAEQTRLTGMNYGELDNAVAQANAQLLAMTPAILEQQRAAGAAGEAISRDLIMAYRSSVPQIQQLGVQAFAAYLEGLGQGKLSFDVAKQLAQSMFDSNTFVATGVAAVDNALAAMQQQLTMDKFNNALRGFFDKWKREPEEIKVTATIDDKVSSEVEKINEEVQFDEKKLPVKSTADQAIAEANRAIKKWSPPSREFKVIPSIAKTTVTILVGPGSGYGPLDWWISQAERKLSGIEATAKLTMGGGAGGGLPNILEEIAVGYDIVAKSFGTYKSMMDARPFNTVIASINGLTAANQSSVNDWIRITNIYNAATASLKNMEAQIKAARNAVDTLHKKISAPSEAYQQQIDRLTLQIMKAEDRLDYAEAARLTLEKERLERKKQELDLQTRISEYVAKTGKPRAEKDYLRMTPEQIASQIAKWQKELVRKQAEVEALEVRYDHLQDSVNEFKSVIDNLAHFLNTRWQEIVNATPERPVPSYASGIDFVPRTGLALIHRGEGIIPEKVNRMRLSPLNVNLDNTTTIITPVILDGQVVARNTTRIQGRNASAMTRSGGRY